MSPRIRSTLTIGVATLLGACATGMEAPEVGMSDVPALEAAVQAAPTDADALTRLGVAYHNAARYTDAVATLDRAVATGEAPPVAHLYLGLSHESLEQWQLASDAYAAYLADASDGRASDQIRQRIGLVERMIMEQELRAMLEQEAALAAQPAQPRTVAVFPFRVVSDDPRYEPLEAALADMVTTDLGIPGALQLIERTRIQALVREMALTLGGYVDPSSGARVGRLMRAENVVQGSVVLLGEDQLRLEMAVVDPARAERRGEAADQTAVADIFDAEKQLVLQVLALLGVTLTDSEREAIEENRTASLIALLSYGEGLEAMDRGDYGGAAAAFSNAARLDPGFQAAQVRAQQASGLQQAAQTSGSQIAAAAQSDVPTAPVEAPAQVATLVDQILPDINRSGADALAQTAQEGSEVSSTPTLQDQNTGGAAGGNRTTVTIILDNPNSPVE